MASSEPATSSNVTVGDLLGDELRARLAELHDLAAAALGAGQQEPEQQAEQDDRAAGARGIRRTSVARGTASLKPSFGSAALIGVDDLVGARRDVVELHVVRALVRLGELHVDALIAVGVDDLGDGVALEELEALLGGDLLRPAEARDEREAHDEEDADQQHVDERIAGDLLEVHGAGDARSLSSTIRGGRRVAATVDSGYRGRPMPSLCIRPRRTRVALETVARVASREASQE